MKQITVRLEDDLHRQVKLRAVREGVAMEALGRRWFEEYAANGRGLVAGEQREQDSGRGIADSPSTVGEPSLSAQSDAPNLPSPAASPREFRPDPKGGKK